mmetsp:Transcript_9600/g.15945  ORF Transcript_9600/g.15945 Transcript_9600/m.15945 type:complete len:266 (-) Transcript_9600:247-1044(-)|eukprot:CAMPEP_0114431058 /NCGR_PEP_ID=MMETSP0103-20121206/10389_1 /TAXON_ID=37642 ORGANISM="Paraphysomonas imperforata, Strain PA2" /NCGR_SAMPLE_ID=MMETSP0103 /ASSEMBLY_ACC=CAM_ASM_000201 /LENGTH=265 /DNA_ID=CAMNT_0001600581 /DNA_START=77 /DNA_END=874 /DNA_ORIENTATION=+
MSFIVDSIFEAFLYFRLGKSDPEQNRVLYHSSTTGSVEEVDLKDLPEKEGYTKRIVIVSDTHDRYRGLNLPAGDIFIHAGDIFMTGRMFSTQRGEERIADFNEWLGGLDFTDKIVVAGNHDKPIQRVGAVVANKMLTNAIYLQSTTVELDSLKFFGCPLSSGHSRNSAFQSESFAKKSKSDAGRASEGRAVDVLVTHGPNFDMANSLKPQLHIFGHAHGLHGVHMPGKKLGRHSCECLTVNASIMDTKYNPLNLPIVLDMNFTSK